MAVHIDYTLVGAGIGAYAAFRVAQFAAKKASTRPPKKIIEDEEEEKVQACKETPDKQRLNSVLPSVVSLQLAVLVFAAAALAHLQLSLLPMIPGLIMFGTYRCVVYRFFPLEVAKTSQTVVPTASLEETNLSTEGDTNSTTPIEPTTKITDASKSTTRATQSAKLHSVMPSMGSVQLAVLVAACAAASHLNMPLEPCTAGVIMYGVYRLVLYNFFYPAAFNSTDNLSQPTCTPVLSATTPVSVGKTADLKSGKKLHSVLPSTVSIQLAILVAAWAAASHVEMPLEPRFGALGMYVVYRFIFKKFFTGKACAKKPEQVPRKVYKSAALQHYLGTPKVSASVANENNSDASHVASVVSDTESKSCSNTKSGAKSHPVQNSVLPSMLSIQLAMLVAAWAAASHLGMPLEPRFGGFVMFAVYLAVDRFVCPLKLQMKPRNFVCKRTDARQVCDLIYKNAGRTHASPQQLLQSVEKATNSTQNVHSVLPSHGSIQLALLVAGNAVASHLGMPAEPRLGAILMYAVYRFILYSFFPDGPSANKPDRAHTDSEASHEVNEAKLQEKNGGAKVTKGAKQHSVLPSTSAYQLAVIAAAWAASSHLGMPLAPKCGALCMYVSYYLVICIFAPHPLVFSSSRNAAAAPCPASTAVVTPPASEHSGSEHYCLTEEPEEFFIGDDDEQ